MKLTKQSIKNPATVAVIGALVLLLGAITLFKLPVQLFPNIETPQITIATFWRAAAPSEMESEIAKPIEEVMAGIPGMEDMFTFTNQGNAFINMEFSLEADMDQVMLEVISRLNRLPAMPADSEPPQVMFGGFGGANESLIWYFAQNLQGEERLTVAQEQFLDDTIIPRIEAIEGVSGVNLQRYSSNGEQLHIVFDPYIAADLGIDLTSIAGRIGRTSDVSGGIMDVGKRQYTLRFKGGYDPEQLAGVILEWRNGQPIRLGDIATITVGPGRQTGFGYQNGRPAVGFQILKASGANVLTTLDQVKSTIEGLNPTLLAENGIRMDKSFDPSVFIMRAINMLSINMGVGILLAIGILWWFLRQMRATLLIALAIPISIFATFLVLGMAGRSFNVISLAGLAFATGMVLDAAIVVLENIVRLRENKENQKEACDKGASQVWGALLASTATTVAIFIPVMFMKDVEGQLFSDLALTIAIGVSVSLVVAVTILPAAASKWLTRLPKESTHKEMWEKLSRGIVKITGTGPRRIAWISGLITVPVVITFLIMPSLNYLPPVKRDAIDGFFMFPSGINAETMDEEVAKVVVERLDPYLKGEKEPKLLNYYLLTWPGSGGAGVGIRPEDMTRIGELEKIVNEEILAGFPDVMAFAQQGNLFGGFGGSDSIQIRLQSADLEATREAAVQGMQLIQARFPEGRVQPNPDPNVVTPELHITPNDERINEIGWNRQQISQVVQALGNGVWLGEHFDGENRLDMLLRSTLWDSPEDLESIPLATPSGAVVPLSNLVTVERSVGPTGIMRINGRRTYNLNFNPPADVPLEEALAILKTEIEPQLRALLPADGSIAYGGSADALDRAVKSLGLNFVLALGLLFLIMAALFKSMKDALLVLISIPLATVGGIAAIRILDLISFQPMDLLTMIGFIILLGLVVNNAILLVVQTRAGQRGGLTVSEAVRNALRLRLRPIFMSTLTSLFGMMPLLLFPGVGSVIYRGMAAAIVGGMSVSTVFTLILLPSLLQLESKDFKQLAMRLFGRSEAASGQAAE
ncbi:MAG: efflux RND transporter permease subunit [Sphingomonadales bacterium]